MLYQSISESEPPQRSALTLRYQVHVRFTGVDGDDEWAAMTSFTTPHEALYGCSQCLESVKDLLEIPLGKEIESSYVEFRVWDSQDRRMIFWEDETGAVCWDDVVFGR